MDSKTFEALMCEEWKAKTFDQLKTEISRPYFDQLWELRNNLYSLVFPLGINGHGIHDVARVSAELNYTWVDDGELSLVGVYTHEQGMEGFAERIAGAEVANKLRNSPGIFNYFVCLGWHVELTHEIVAKHACYHLQNNILKEFTACNFTQDVFQKLYLLKPLFERAETLGRSEDINSYYNLKKEIDLLVQQIIKG